MNRGTLPWPAANTFRLASAGAWKRRQPRSATVPPIAIEALGLPQVVVEAGEIVTVVAGDGVTEMPVAPVVDGVGIATDSDAEELLRRLLADVISLEIGGEGVVEAAWLLQAVLMTNHRYMRRRLTLALPTSVLPLSCRRAAAGLIFASLRPRRFSRPESVQTTRTHTHTVDCHGS